MFRINACLLALVMLLPTVVLHAQSLTVQLHESAIAAVKARSGFTDALHDCSATLSMCDTRIPKVQRKLNQFNGSPEYKKALQLRLNQIKQDVDYTKTEHDANKLDLQASDKTYQDGKYQELLARSSLNEASIIAYAKEAIRLYNAAKGEYIAGKARAEQILNDAELALNELNELEASFTY